jgi:hypothetical protein
MKFQGKVLITDEAIEVFKNVNLSNWKIKTYWDKENLLLRVDCQPSDTSFSWKWNEINNLLEFGEGVIPFSAIEVRHRDAIALVFNSEKETDFCKPLLSSGEIYEIGILSSNGFLLNENIKFY